MVKCNLNQRQNNRDPSHSHSYRASANLGNVVLARPSTFVRCVLLLPSNMNTLVAGFAFFLFLKEKSVQHSKLIFLENH